MQKDVLDFEKTYLRIVKNIELNKAIATPNKKTILEWLEKRKTEPDRYGKQRKPGTMAKLATDCLGFGRILENTPLETVAKDEKTYDAFAKQIREHPSWNPNTQAQRLKALQQLLKETYEVGQWFAKKRTGVVGHKTPDERTQFTSTEMRKMQETASTERNKAIIAVLRHGLRPAEVLRLNRGDITFDAEGRSIIHVRNGKTGSRVVPTRRGAFYLRDWLEKHPFKQADVALFITQKSMGLMQRDWTKSRMSYSYLLRVTKSIIKQASVEKENSLYNWRKSSISEFFRNGGSIRVASKIYGTSLLQMQKSYDACRNDEVLAEIDQQAGVEKKIIAPEVVSELAKDCLRCGAENASTVVRCVACGWELDKKNPVMVMEKQMEAMQEEMRILNALVTRKIDPNKDRIDTQVIKQILLGLEGEGT